MLVVHKKVQQAFGHQNRISFLSISPSVFLSEADNGCFHGFPTLWLIWNHIRPLKCKSQQKVDSPGQSDMDFSSCITCYLYHYGVASMVVGRINNAECFLNTIYQHNLSVLMGTFKKKHFRKDTNLRLPGKPLFYGLA